VELINEKYNLSNNLEVLKSDKEKFGRKTK
jgi:hypothetical protein